MRTLSLLAISLISVISCQQKNKSNIFPPEKFSVIEAKLANGKPIIGSINMAYKNYDSKADYPWCLEINIALELKNVTKEGLPLKSESDIANKFEDSLINIIRKLTTTHYVGHMYNDSFLDTYAYIDDPEKVNQYLQEKIKSDKFIRGFRFEIKRDPGWDTVEPFFNSRMN